LEPEHTLEERRRPVADRPARRALAPSFLDQSALDEARDGGIGCHAADLCDIRPRARAEIRDDGKRLERRLREAALHRSLEQARTRVRRLATRTKRETSRDLLEHDPAPTFAVALPQERK